MSTNSPAVTEPQQPQKPPVAITSRGITPNNMDDLFRFAKAVSSSGLAPKGIESPEAIFVALEMGLEVGLPLMSSLQNIAVINGRPTIWGDAQLAVVRGTGELEVFEEWYEDKGQRLPRNPVAFTDETVAVCRIKRRGYEAAETGFSVADAKRANLWGKQGPWTQYPARMLRFRARSFGLRDLFGDALRGLMSTEEARDGELVNVTPEVPSVPEVPAAPARAYTKKSNPIEASVVQPAPPPSDPAPNAQGPNQAKVEALFAKAGLTFDDFLRSNIAKEYLDGINPASFSELPDELAVRVLGRRQDCAVFIGAIRMEKESAA